MCDPPPLINFTTLSISSKLIDSDYLVYDCIPGYERLRGDNIRTCLISGGWRGTDLECISKIFLSFYSRNICNLNSIF